MKCICFGLLFMIFVLSSYAQNEEKRIALLIGNSAYKDFPLEYPANDARNLSTELKNLGFEVMEFTDLSLSDMNDQIREFGFKVTHNSATGIFFFSGHGFQMGGENYLIPFDAVIENKQDFASELFCVKDLMNAIKSEQNNLNIIILDVYPANPFKNQIKLPNPIPDGLAFIEIPTNTMVVYTAAPNQMPSDKYYMKGLWVSEFIQSLKSPNLYVEEIIKNVRRNVMKKSDGFQVPWNCSTISNDIYLNKK